jgi:hypothetical protein
VACGTKLHRYPKDMMETAFEECVALHSKSLAKSPNWKKVYEGYAKFRSEQNRWFRFAEAGFDGFMQAQRFSLAGPARPLASQVCAPRPAPRSGPCSWPNARRPPHA